MCSLRGGAQDHQGLCALRPPLCLRSLPPLSTQSSSGVTQKGQQGVLLSGSVAVILIIISVAAATRLLLRHPWTYICHRELIACHLERNKAEQSGCTVVKCQIYSGVIVVDKNTISKEHVRRAAHIRHLRHSRALSLGSLL